MQSCLSITTRLVRSTREMASGQTVRFYEAWRLTGAGAGSAASLLAPNTVMRPAAPRRLGPRAMRAVRKPASHVLG